MARHSKRYEHLHEQVGSAGVVNLAGAVSVLKKLETSLPEGVSKGSFE